MNKDTQNIYEAYITESPERIKQLQATIDTATKELASLQQSGAPTTSSSTSTTTTDTVSSRRGTSNRDINKRAKANAAAPAKQAASNKAQNASNLANYGPGAAAFQSGAGQFDTAPAQQPKTVQPKIDQPKDAEDTAAGDAAATASGGTQTAAGDAAGDAAATASGDDDPYGLKAAGSPEDYQTPWDKEQQRIQNSGQEMPTNWQNASWAKRARAMGGRNPARVKQLAQKEWERKEAMRKEREMATSELNPNRQTGMQYFGNQLKKVPGNVGAAVQGLGSAIFGKNKIPQTTATGDAVYGSDGKLQWKDNSTGKPGLVQRAGGAVKKALTPSKPAAAASPPTAPANSQPKKISGPVQKDRFGRPVVNRRKSRVLNQSTNAFDAVLQDKNVDHLID